MTWESVDGTRDGRMEQPGQEPVLWPGCRDGQRAVTKGGRLVPGRSEPCTPKPAYRSDLPTTADAMLAYLDANASGEPGNVNARGKDVPALLGGSYLPPATRAALFEAAARVPGLSVVPDATDGAGRAGIGITWPLPPKSDDRARPVVLVFDKESYVFLGTQGWAVVAQSIVDEVGRRP